MTMEFFSSRGFWWGDGKRVLQLEGGRAEAINVPESLPCLTPGTRPGKEFMVDLQTAQGGESCSFASAERLDQCDVERQSRLFIDTPLSGSLETLPLPVVVLNRCRQVVYSNAEFSKLVRRISAENILGRRPGEVLGCVNSGIGPGGCGTSEFCGYCGAVRAILDSLRGRPGVQECHIRYKEGEREDSMDVLTFCAPLAHKNENFVQFMLVDVSADKRLKTMERIFFHDLMNTASGVHSLIQLLERQNLSDNSKQCVDMLRCSSSQLMGEISDYRSFVAMESDELTANPLLLNSGQMVEDVLSVYRHHVLADGKTVEVEHAGGTFSFEADPVLFKRVLGNMVKNALEATGRGGVIRIHARREEDEAVFFVTNPGYMIPSVSCHVFKRFFSTKGSGRGLGTYSMKVLVERYMGGRVDFTTSRKQGTCFTVRIPASG
jgi:hypothetical protein